ncbi:MAG: hypothetical protein J7J20_00750 [Desulfurococcales archaeon]|nr:hypothetical protein [Desulfurococcales archaeon]
MLLKTVLAAAAVSAVVLASVMYLDQIGVIDIVGTVNVPGESVTVSLHVIEFELPVNTSSGEITYGNLGVLRTNKELEVLLKPAVKEVEGNLTISLSGEVLLVSDEKTYTIKMPCLMTVNTSCFRAAVLIPGYDEPLRIQPGEYNITLRLAWSATEGQGVFKLQIVFITGKDNGAYILPASGNVDTGNWTVAEGSTRTYMLLLEKTKVKASNCFGETRVLAWLFSPREIEHADYVFKLINAKTGNVLTVLNVPAIRDGTYYKALVLIKAKLGHYIIEVEYPSTGQPSRTVMRAKISIEE